MGIYLNPDNTLFMEAANSEIYVDKTMLINFTNQVISTSQKHICVSRPRRFGKSIAENMLVAYYSKGCDSKELFSRFKIASAPDFEKHLNQYNVIHVNMRDFADYGSAAEMIKNLSEELIFDIKTEFENCRLYNETNLVRTLKDVYAQTRQKFIFIFKFIIIFSFIFINFIFILINFFHISYISKILLILIICIIYFSKNI